MAGSPSETSWQPSDDGALSADLQSVPTGRHQRGVGRAAEQARRVRWALFGGLAVAQAAFFTCRPAALPHLLAVGDRPATGHFHPGGGSIRFDAQLPESGEPIEAEAFAREGQELPPLHWRGADHAVVERSNGAWTVAWPEPDRAIELIDSDGTALLTLPTPRTDDRCPSAGMVEFSDRQPWRICVEPRRGGPRFARLAARRVLAVWTRLGAR
jgi:hypothetical protein